MSKKPYPLHVIVDEDVCWSKGHHDKEAFRQEMRTEWQRDAPIEHIHHVWYKLVPSENWNDSRMTWVDVGPECRGAVPFTVSDECYTKSLEVE